MKKKFLIISIFTIYIFSSINIISYADNKIDRTFKNLDSFIYTLEQTYKGVGSNQLIDSAKNSIIVRYAMEELGKPYVYGGNGPDVFDCSGLTKYVFSKAEISIPRVSYEQGNGGTEIAKDKMLPGDLVFFDTRNSNDFSDIKVDTEDIIPLFELTPNKIAESQVAFMPQKVTHVGIYIADGKFIHASSGSEMQVVIADLNNKYFSQRFLFAKRYI